MKHILFLIAVLLGSIGISANAAASNGSKGELMTVVYSVGMHCDNCKKKIESNIAFEKGVKDLKVDLASKTVTVTYRTDKTDSEKLLNAIKKLGYTVLIKEEKAADAQKK